MPTVAVMLVGREAQALAAEQIGTLATVRFCESIGALRELVAGGDLDAVVADLRDGSGESILPTLAALRVRRPHLPLVLHCVPTPEALRDLPETSAFRHGLSLVFRNAEHLGAALRPVLRPPGVPSAAETLARHLVPLVPGPFRPFVLVCSLKASPRLKVGTAARWSGATRRTLERSLKRAGLPSAGSMLGSCTALHAAWWLDVQGWSTKHVVTEMQFSHASALIRLLRGHFGASLRSVRVESGFQELLSRFELTLLGDADPRARLQSF
jgi:hypothetical protein